MKIIDIAVKKVYRFNCPNCQSRLEADSKEVVDIGGKVCKFHCPMCRKERYIAWSDMRKKIVYGLPLFKLEILTSPLYRVTMPDNTRVDRLVIFD